MVAFLHPAWRIAGLLIAVLAAGSGLRAQAAATQEGGWLPLRFRVQVVDEMGDALSGVAAALVPAAELDASLVRRAPAAVTPDTGIIELGIRRGKQRTRPGVLVLSKPGRTTIRYDLNHNFRKRKEHNDPLRQPEDAAQRAGFAAQMLIGRIRGAAEAAAPSAVLHDLGQISMPPGQDCRVQVLGPDGKGLRGIQVEAELALRRQPRTTATGFPARVRWYTAGSSQKDGWLLLCGLPRSAVILSLRKEGFEHITRRVLPSQGPIQLRLRAARKVSGQILDAAGKPCRARVSLRHESGAGIRHKTTTADGKFEFQVMHPQRFRLIATPSGIPAKTHGPAYSKPLNASHSGLRLQLPPREAKPKKPRRPRPKPRKPVKVGPGAAPSELRVVVTDAATGLALDGFRAWVIWKTQAYQQNRSYLEGRMRGSGSKPRAPGVIRLRGPAKATEQFGAVRIQAKGYAPYFATGIEWDPRRPPRLQARLVPGAVLGGQVAGLTPALRKGARAYLSGTDGEGRNMRSRQLPLDASGCFRFEELPAGDYLLRVRIGGRYGVNHRFRLSEGELRMDFRQDTSKGAELRGRLRGLPVTAGGRVLLVPESTGRRLLSNPLYSAGGTVAELDVEGRFQFSGLKLQQYELVLRIDGVPRRGSQVYVPLEPLRIRAFNPELDIDVAPDLPQRFRGRLRTPGLDLDPRRYIVSAELPASVRNPYSYYSTAVRQLRLSAAWTEVGADGRFSLLLPRGEWCFRVVDTLTGVSMLPRLQPVDLRSGSQTEALDFDLRLHRVRVRLVPVQPGSRVTARWLDLRCTWPAGNRWSSESSRFYASGVSLLDGVTEHEFFLPPGKLRLRAHSGLDQLAAPLQKLKTQVGVLEAQVPVPGDEPLEIKVQLPSIETPEPVPPKAAEKQQEKGG